MSFKITGPGLYRTRDGRKAEVVRKAKHSGFPWAGKIGIEAWYWSDHGVSITKPQDDLIAQWEEPVAPTTPAPTPYHRTDQFRAETAVKLLLEMARNPNPTWADTALLAVETVDALIAFLDTPQEYDNEPAEWTGEAVETKAQLHRVHNQEVSK